MKDNKDKSNVFILWFDDISHKDVEIVGGKNASLGEMYSELRKKGVNIPDGFCLTSFAYRYFLKKNGIDKKLEEIFKKFDSRKIKNIEAAAKKIINLILQAEFPPDLEKEILENYKILSKKIQRK